ncbi:MAG TPA: DUF1565 domain-containing protein [Deltaproteobacteria bacterium]|nr:DUF1565 domain-containing protein [Deltaproteobacteria bacterium]
MILVAKRFLWGLAVSAVVLSAAAVHAAVLNVPGDHRTIQEAVDRAAPGDTVRVAPGTYRGNVVLGEGVVLQGAGAAETTIVGDGTGSVIVGAKGAVIEGFTITGSGTKGTTGTMMDAGISGNNAPMTIANNIIKGNNTGIKLYYSPSYVINNVIASSRVHGVYLSYSDARVRNNIITGNGGYGVYVSYSTPELTNNTIWGNSFGIYSEVSSVAVKNNIVARNEKAGISWAELPEAQEGVEPRLSHNLVWGNGTDYVNVSAGPGGLSADPRLKDPSGGDFRLASGSPAAGAGENGADLGAYGGEEAQAHLPLPPSQKSYASLKPDFGATKEPDYMSAAAWSEGTGSGRGNFDSYCVTCHGPGGAGDGILAETLDVRPRDLTNKELLSQRTDEFLFKVIRNGGASVGFSENMMPFSNTLSDDEIRAVISYIRSELCKCKYEGGE